MTRTREAVNIPTPTGGAAVITGGASGIGLAIASMLKARGWEVCLLDRSAEGLARACAELTPPAPVMWPTKRRCRRRSMPWPRIIG